MTEVEGLKSRLREHFNIRYDLKLNENRSTMVSVLERRPRYARLSLHRMFLKAPDLVLADIAALVRGEGGNGTLRGYIQTNLGNYTQKPGSLVTAGEMYDLKELFDELNAAYFDGALALHLTWFGERGLKRHRRRITYGQYVDNLKLIKMNRLLDDPFFPPYFVRFILYHEMVHAVVPSYLDDAGRCRSHGAAFKARERLFADYDRALAWEKRHKQRIFR